MKQGGYFFSNLFILAMEAQSNCEDAWRDSSWASRMRFLIYCLPMIPWIYMTHQKLEARAFEWFEATFFLINEYGEK